MSRGDLVAAELADLLEPVGVEAVVGDALVVVVEDAVAGRWRSKVTLPSSDLNG